MENLLTSIIQFKEQQEHQRNLQTNKNKTTPARSKITTIRYEGSNPGRENFNQKLQKEATKLAM